jgi:hypothetical protein
MISLNSDHPFLAADGRVRLFLPLSNPLNTSGAATSVKICKFLVTVCQSPRVVQLKRDANKDGNKKAPAGPVA